jgi:hypothetical protein
MMLVGIAQAADLVVFSNGGVADADDVNANFNELETRIETITLTPGPVGADSTVAGPKGDTGANSTVAGPKGDTGANSTVAGPKGDTGADSTVAGPKGDTGANSTVAGPKGDTGADSTVAGPKGDTGADSTVAGPKGDTGADSTVAGPKGDTGADSTVAGPKGDTGLGAVVFSSAPTVNDDMNSPYSVGTVWVDTSTNMLYILEDNTANAAVWTIAAAPAVKYAIGDPGPAGGIVFYVTAGGLRGLEAAPSDQDTGTGIRWDSVDSPNTDTGAIADGIGAGDMNTTLIIAETAGDQATYAAGIAANLVITHSGVDYGDWYLPSKFELNLMWLNLANSGLGGFASFYYWSSSQSSSNYAWHQSFGYGSQFDDGKYFTYRVRAVRAF